MLSDVQCIPSGTKFASLTGVPHIHSRTKTFYFHFETQYKRKYICDKVAPNDSVPVYCKLSQAWFLAIFRNNWQY